MTTAIMLSGGMDSTAVLYWKRPAVAYTVDYGQSSFLGEMRAAEAVCTDFDIHHEVIRVNCRKLGSGDLAGLAPNPHAPVSEWWPYRNQLLVTLGAMKAIADGVQTLLFGSVKSDGIHIDGRKEFFSRLSELLQMQEGGLTVEVPAIDFTSAELIVAAKIPPAILSWSHSCHTAEYACGKCRGCNKHREVMTILGYENY